MNTKKQEDQVVIYKNSENQIDFKVELKNETIWLSLNQIAKLFNIDKSGVSRHIKNIFNDMELEEKLVVAFFATTTRHGAVKRKMQIKNVKYYNLDVILSVGYRVNSKQATNFRIWASSILKQYLKDSYVINLKRLKKIEGKFTELQNTIALLDKNNFLYKKNGEKKFNDNALTTLTLLVAISNPKEKDIMIKLIINLLNNKND